MIKNTVSDESMIEKATSEITIGPTNDRHTRRKALQNITTMEIMMKTKKIDLRAKSTLVSRMTAPTMRLISQAPDSDRMQI